MTTTCTFASGATGTHTISVRMHCHLRALLSRTYAAHTSSAVSPQRWLTLLLCYKHSHTQLLLLPKWRLIALRATGTHFRRYFSKMANCVRATGTHLVAQRRPNILHQLRQFLQLVVSQYGGCFEPPTAKFHECSLFPELAPSYSRSDMDREPLQILRRSGRTDQKMFLDSSNTENCFGRKWMVLDGRIKHARLLVTKYRFILTAFLYSDARWANGLKSNSCQEN